jgi:hypothetical protein
MVTSKILSITALVLHVGCAQQATPNPSPDPTPNPTQSGFSFKGPDGRQYQTAADPTISIDPPTQIAAARAQLGFDARSSDGNVVSVFGYVDPPRLLDDPWQVSVLPPEPLPLQVGSFLIVVNRVGAGPGTMTATFHDGAISAGISASDKVIDGSSFAGAYWLACSVVDSSANVMGSGVALKSDAKFESDFCRPFLPIVPPKERVLMGL